MKPIPIAIDTDIGGDVDDALALGLVLESPEFDLRAITTVRGNVSARTQLTHELLGVYAKDSNPAIPVAAGASEPLGENWHQAAEAAQPSPIGADAVNLLAWQIEKARSAKERLTVVAIGSLTNIALLLARHPELINAFDLVWMGGNWGGDRPKPEWNSLCDPEAAAVVFQSGMMVKMVGLDVTRHCILSEEEVARFAQASPRSRFLDTQIKKWGRRVVLHDPLTFLALISPYVTFEPMRIEVPLTGDCRAWTVPVAGTPNTLVATRVDAESAKKLFLDRVLR